VGIQRIRLGPKSPHAMPAELQQAVDQVIAEAPKEDFLEAVLGCTCGGLVGERDGVVHRRHHPCYVKGASKQTSMPIRPPLEARVAALEKVLTALTRQQQVSRGPACVCGCLWAEHATHIDDDWKRYAGACLSCPCTHFEAVRS
jgi:hypothetical protein